VSAVGSEENTLRRKTLRPDTQDLQPEKQNGRTDLLPSRSAAKNLAPTYLY